MSDHSDQQHSGWRDQQHARPSQGYNRYQRTYRPYGRPPSSGGSHGPPSNGQPYPAHLYQGSPHESNYHSHSHGGSSPHPSERSVGRAPQGPSRIDSEPSRTIFVRNVNYNVTLQTLHDVFGGCGKVKSLNSLALKRGIAFVTYYDLRGAQRAFNELDGVPIEGRPITVHYSVPRDGELQEACDMNKNQGTLDVAFEDASPAPSVDQVRQLFAGFGPVRSVRPQPEDSTRFLVEWFDSRDANHALTELPSREFHGAKIHATIVWDVPVAQHFQAKAAIARQRAERYGPGDQGPVRRYYGASPPQQPYHRSSPAPSVTSRAPPAVRDAPPPPPAPAAPAAPVAAAAPEAPAIAGLTPQLAQQLLQVIVQQQAAAAVAAAAAAAAAPRPPPIAPEQQLLASLMSQPSLLTVLASALRPPEVAPAAPVAPATPVPAPPPLRAAAAAEPTPPAKENDLAALLRAQLSRAPATSAPLSKDVTVSPPQPPVSTASVSTSPAAAAPAAAPASGAALAGILSQLYAASSRPTS